MRCQKQVACGYHVMQCGRNAVEGGSFCQQHGHEAAHKRELQMQWREREQQIGQRIKQARNLRRERAAALAELASCSYALQQLDLENMGNVEEMRSLLMDIKPALHAFLKCEQEMQNRT